MANHRKRARPDDYFKDWKQREALAEGMIPLVGRLSREKNVTCYIYGKPLVNRSVFEIMKDHRYVRQVEGNELSEKETFPVFNLLSQLDLGPAHIDVGRLAVGYVAKGVEAGLSLEQYLNNELGPLIGAKGKPIEKPQDVEPALREARKLKDRTVFMDFRTDPTENVFPMVKAGKGINEMLLGSEDL